jgi:Winged helix-turn helix
VSRVTVRLTSDGELARLEVLRDLDQRRLTTEAAARLLGLERRQVFRLLQAYRTAGPAGLISKRRGRRSKRLGPILAMIRDEQLRRGPERRSGPA